MASLSWALGIFMVLESLNILLVKSFIFLELLSCTDTVDLNPYGCGVFWLLVFYRLDFRLAVLYVWQSVCLQSFATSHCVFACFAIADNIVTCMVAMEINISIGQMFCFVMTLSNTMLCCMKKLLVVKIKKLSPFHTAHNLGDQSLCTLTNCKIIFFVYKTCINC